MKTDVLEERVNLQERLLLKVREDLIKVRESTTEQYRQTRINEIIDYLGEYKIEG